MNGEEADVLRANYNLKAVRVPAGRSRVELEYRPRGLEAGIGVTLATLFMPFAVVLGRRWRRSRRLSAGAERSSGGAG